MKIFSKKADIVIVMHVNSVRGSEELRVEISMDEVIFRARSLRTELSIERAKNPSQIYWSISALIPNMFEYELDLVVPEIHKYVKLA
ncbi:hypothetical protein AVV36_gp076 [Pectobacterium bacteriophage PM2]|uniref:Uncharacterized protein n=1 Tax=Pectobacterium bacteriophage PM2 TaxID=1429794 RepID=A0A0A0Q0K0_9CAUD|nr:hypothetical protein AVV36_gp076 [Pectobacterium bacteriophage PM2]AHY25038.1 hypothetical protein PM2_076 [Pectobacterium bacteriophage PM2]